MLKLDLIRKTSHRLCGLVSDFASKAENLSRNRTYTQGRDDFRIVKARDWLLLDIEKIVDIADSILAYEASVNERFFQVLNHKAVSFSEHPKLNRCLTFHETLMAGSKALLLHIHSMASVDSLPSVTSLKLGESDIVAIKAAWLDEIKWTKTICIPYEWFNVSIRIQSSAELWWGSWKTDWPMPPGYWSLQKELQSISEAELNKKPPKNQNVESNSRGRRKGLIRSKAELEAINLRINGDSFDVIDRLFVTKNRLRKEEVKKGSKFIKQKQPWKMGDAKRVWDSAKATKELSFAKETWIHTPRNESD